MEISEQSLYWGGVGVLLEDTKSKMLSVMFKFEKEKFSEL